MCQLLKNPDESSHVSLSVMASVEEVCIDITYTLHQGRVKSGQYVIFNRLKNAIILLQTITSIN